MQIIEKQLIRCAIYFHILIDLIKWGHFCVGIVRLRQLHTIKPSSS